MKVAIQQAHYFPWLGYLDKLAKVDKFIIMDTVQLTDSSVAIRNKFLENTGKEKLLSVSIDKKGYLEKKSNEIELKDWERVRKKHSRFLFYNYKNSEFFEEVWKEIEFIFEKEYKFLFDLQLDILKTLMKLFNLKTEIVFQSSLIYNYEAKKNDLVLELCKAVKANYYLSGNGAKKYMELAPFEKENIKVVFQKFSYPQYKQKNSVDFIPNLSSLDLLFNCGIEKANEIFWTNVRNNKESEV